MSRNESTLFRSWWGRLGLMLLVGVLLAGCASGPEPVAEPRLRTRAQEVESEAERRHVQGDHAGAARQFAEAARLYASMDNPKAASRNRLYQARAELAQGEAELALEHANAVTDEELQVQALLLRVQANLALGRVDVARPLLNRVTPLCGSNCPERGSFWLLRARMAWVDGLMKAALADAEAAVPVLRSQGETRELANAWRLIAAARLHGGQAASALAAAQSALELDRQQALPEKIARDWLLIGDILRRAGKPEYRSAYLRARSVAEAAGLTELSQLAAQALTEENQ